MTRKNNVSTQVTMEYDLSIKIEELRHPISQLDVEHTVKQISRDIDSQ